MTYSARFVCSLIIVLVFSWQLTAQKKPQVQVMHRAERYYLKKNCYQVIRWDAVRLPDAAVSNQVNTMIRNAAREDRLADGGAEFCSGLLEYDQECNLVYRQYPVLSYYFTTFSYYKGAAHGSRSFRTINVDARNGKRIDFNALFRAEQLAALDTFIINRLDSQLVHFGGGKTEEWLNQVSSPEFNLSDKGINVLFRGSAYVLSVIEVFISFDELQAYIDSKGLLPQCMQRRPINGK